MAHEKPLSVCVVTITIMKFDRMKETDTLPMNRSLPGKIKIKL